MRPSTISRFPPKFPNRQLRIEDNMWSWSAWLPLVVGFVYTNVTQHIFCCSGYQTTYLPSLGYLDGSSFSFLSPPCPPISHPTKIIFETITSLQLLSSSNQSFIELLHPFTQNSLTSTPEYIDWCRERLMIFVVGCKASNHLKNLCTQSPEWLTWTCAPIFMLIWMDSSAVLLFCILQVHTEITKCSKLPTPNDFSATGWC